MGEAPTTYPVDGRGVTPCVRRRAQAGAVPCVFSVVCVASFSGALVCYISFGVFVSCFYDGIIFAKDGSRGATCSHVSLCVAFSWCSRPPTPHRPGRRAHRAAGIPALDEASLGFLGASVAEWRPSEAAESYHFVAYVCACAGCFDRSALFFTLPPSPGQPE